MKFYCPSGTVIHGHEVIVGRMTDSGDVSIKRYSNFSYEVGTFVPGDWNKSVALFQSGTIRCGGCGADCFKKNLGRDFQTYVWLCGPGGQQVVMTLPQTGTVIPGTTIIG